MFDGVHPGSIVKADIGRKSIAASHQRREVHRADVAYRPGPCVRAASNAVFSMEMTARAAMR
jgi:hypothetical protein